MIFNGDLLRYNALEDYIGYKVIFDFVHDKAALKTHIEALPCYTIGPTPRGSVAKLRKQRAQDIYNGLNHYGSQTIVSLSTTYEVATKEFLYCFFMKYPQHIYDYVGSEETKGHVSLKEILKVKSYQELLSNLASRAASVATKGEYGQVLIKISKLCNESSPKELAERLNSLQLNRNKIIHEKHARPWAINHPAASYRVLKRKERQLSEVLFW